MIYSLIFILTAFSTVYGDSELPALIHPNPTTEIITQDSLVKMEIKGLYEHRNLFISNPVLANGKRCITQAPQLNGMPTSKVTDSNVLEIKLSEYELDLGEVIQLVIWHSPACKPVI